MAVAAVAEQRVGAFAESYVFVLHGGIGIAFASTVKFRISRQWWPSGLSNPCFFAVRIEMRAGGFKVGAIALRVLMKMDGGARRAEDHEGEA